MSIFLRVRSTCIPKNSKKYISNITLLYHSGMLILSSLALSKHPDIPYPLKKREYINEACGMGEKPPLLSIIVPSLKKYVTELIFHSTKIHSVLCCM